MGSPHIKPIVVLAFLLADCRPTSTIDADVPGDVSHVAVLTFEQDRFVASTSLFRWTGVLPVAVAADEVLLVGYSESALRDLPEVVAEPLVLATICQPSLPAPSWVTRFSDDRLQENTRLEIPQLTASWLQGCPSEALGAVVASGTCFDEPCRVAVRNTSDCNVELDLAECGKGELRAAAHVSYDGQLCAEIKTAGWSCMTRGSGFIDCAEPACEMRLEVRTPDPDWILVSTPHAPSPRSGAALAYDSDRERVVLFGGFLSDRTADDETWEYDGSDWTQVTTAHSPPHRHDHSMTYEAARQRIILFGGAGASPDTWAYDGSDWTLIATATTPPCRHRHRLVYHEQLQRIIMFGGRLNGGSELDDTWEFDGDNWIELHPPTKPTARRSVAMVYDRHRQRIVQFSGIAGSTRFFSDTWAFDGSDWVELSTTDIPPRRQFHDMAYHASRQRTVMFGGQLSLNRADTWAYDGDNWRRLLPAAYPFGRQSHAMTYDAKRRRVVLFGGFGGIDFFNDTWER